MTLCLAAHCIHRSKQAIVLATDYESENEMVGAEIQSKVTQLEGGYFFLSAGTHTRATELIAVCETHISKGITSSFYDLLRQAVTIQKHNLADEYVAGQLGITYSEFLKDGKEKVPEEIFRDMVSSIRNITLGCSLLAVDFSSSDRPSIYRVQETGMIEMCDNFAAVGSGLYIAESALFLRAHTENDSLKNTLFEVYEAMRLGSKAPGVGENFSLLVVSKENGEIALQLPTFAYAKTIGAAVDKYGLRGYRIERAPILKNVKSSEANIWGIRIKKLKSTSVSKPQSSVD